MNKNFKKDSKNIIVYIKRVFQSDLTSENFLNWTWPKNISDPKPMSSSFYWRRFFPRSMVLYNDPRGNVAIDGG
jgi:hypothetical protein